MPASERQTLLADVHLVPRTAHTATSTAGLNAAIDVASQKGLAVDDEENEIGMRCVAAPILNADGWPLAAISVSGPSSRMSHTEIERIGAELRSACASVSRTLARY